jgi:hypothetical protein
MSTQRLLNHIEKQNVAGLLLPLMNQSRTFAQAKAIVIVQKQLVIEAAIAITFTPFTRYRAARIYCVYEEPWSGSMMPDIVNIAAQIDSHDFFPSCISRDIVFKKAKKECLRGLHKGLENTILFQWSHMLIVYPYLAKR